MSGVHVAQQPKTRRSQSDPSLWLRAATKDTLRPRVADGSNVEDRGSPSFQRADARRLSNATNSVSTAPARVSRHEQEQFVGPKHTNPASGHVASELCIPGTDQSVIPLSSGAPPTSQFIMIQLWMSARPQVTSLRDVILATRIGLRREKSQHCQQEVVCDRVMDDLITVLGSAMVQGLNSESQDTLNRLLHELKGSRNELKSLRERAAALEDSLSRYEYQLQRIEEDVYQELDRELQDNRAPHEPHLESSSAGIIEPKTHDTGTATELRDMLYSRMGDIRIHLERLNNFEFDLQDELQERDILRAAGNAEVTTDAEFFEHARGERARIQQELEDAQVEVSKLKERCIQNNIGFEDPQFAEVLYQPGMDSLVTASGLGEPQMEEHQGSSTIINAFFNAQERIKQWLEKPSGSPNSEPDATKEARQEWTRRDSSSSDAGWVMTPSLVRPPSSLRTVGMNGLAESELPQWRAGPPPGSSLIEALLLESSSTPLGYGHQPKTNITVKARQSLP